MEMAIETWGLTKRYRRNNVALHNIYLRIPRGVGHALLGPPGAGKTTFLKIIMGMQKPSSGGGFCMGFDLVTENILIREKVGFVTGDINLYGHLSVQDMLKLTRSFYPSWNEPLVRKYLDGFALSPRKKVRDLSYEQRYLLALLLAISFDPGLLILDEPTVLFKDDELRQTFFQAVKKELVERGKTALLFTRDLEEIKMLATVVSLIYGGQLLGTYQIDELVNDDLPAEAEEICRLYLSGEGKS